MHLNTLGSAVAMSRPVTFRRDPQDLLAVYGMWVDRCVRLNASVAASVPCRLYRIERSADVRKSMLRLPSCRALDRLTEDYIAGRCDVRPSPSVKAMVRGNEDNLVEVTEHPVLDLLQNVNRWSDGYAYRESLYSDLQVFGRAYSLVIDEGGEPRSLWRMLPRKTKVLPDPEEFVAGFTYGTGASVETYSPDDVIWFRLFDPENPWGGLGPLEAWYKTIRVMHHVTDFQSELFARGGAPDYILRTKGVMSQDQKRAWRREWRKLFGRLFRRESTVGIIDGGESEIERLTDSPRELEFSASMDQIRDQIGQAFGVPKAMLTTDAVNLANAKAAEEQHMRGTIWPYVQRVEDVLNEQLVSRWDGNLFLMHENPIRADRAMEAADRQSKLSSGWSINEIRIEAGAEPLDDELADVPLVASGYQSLERAIDGPDLLGMMGGGEDDDDGDGGGDDEPDTEDDPDGEALANEMEARGFRLVQPVTVNGHCGCGAAKQSDMLWKAMSDKPEEIDEPARELTKALAKLITGWTIEAAARAEGAGTTIPGVDVILPDGERGAMEGAAAGEAEPHVAAATRTAGAKAMQEIGASEAFDIDAPAVRAFISDQSFLVARNTVDGFRRSIQPIVLEAFSGGLTPAELAKRIEAETDRAGWRAERVATTEIGFASTAAREKAWEQSGVVVGKRWLLSADACPLCVAMAAEFNAERRPLGYKLREVGSTFSYQDEGSEREVRIDYRDVNGGDAHPYCRCTIIADIEGD